MSEDERQPVWHRCERCQQNVDISEAETPQDAAGILLAHLALDCAGNTELRAPDPRIEEAAASAELAGADVPEDWRDRAWAESPQFLGPEAHEQTPENYFSRWDLVSVGGVVLRTHHERVCRPPCCIHSPSGHHMREWQQAWSQQLQTVFRRCPHGHFHPDPDDLQARTGALLHTCDGCCLAP